MSAFFIEYNVLNSQGSISAPTRAQAALQTEQPEPLVGAEMLPVEAPR